MFGIFWVTSDVALFFRCFFIFVASIIGLGVLSLPVRMYDCGFGPFVVMFLICGIMQAVKSQIMMEVLQRATTISTLRARNDALSANSLEMEFIVTGLEEGASPQQPELVDRQPTRLTTTPKVDFHTLGVLLLPSPLPPIYDLSVLLHYGTLSAVYGISASQTYAALTHVRIDVVLPVYMIVASLFVCFGSGRLQPFVATVTLLKGTILIVVIAMTSVAGFDLFKTSHSNWANIGDPFI
eukprot:PhM_4_TR11706/c0_g1_i6/m.86055